MAVGTSRQLQVDAPSVSLNLLVATLTMFDRPTDLPLLIDVSTHPYFSYRVPVSVDWFIDRLSKLTSHFSSPSSNLHAVSWFAVDVELLQLTLITIFLQRHRLDDIPQYPKFERRHCIGQTHDGVIHNFPPPRTIGRPLNLYFSP